MAAIGFGLTVGTINTSLKQPHECESVPYRIESFRRMASGVGRKDVLSTVQRWRVGWRNLTYAQWQTLDTLWRVNAPIWFRDAEGNSWLVILVSDAASTLTPLAGGTHRYSVSWDLEWVGTGSGAAGVFTFGISTIGGPDPFGGQPGRFTFGASAIGGNDGLAPS